MTIDADLQALASGTSFAALTTLAADGQPRTHIMWIDEDGEHLLFNTEVDRAKFKDLTRDPRATITVFNPGNPYQYVEARGRVVDTVTGDAARAHLDELSRRYTGGDYANPIHSDRVMVKFAPEKIHKSGF